MCTQPPEESITEFQMLFEKLGVIHSIAETGKMSNLIPRLTFKFFQ